MKKLTIALLLAIGLSVTAFSPFAHAATPPDSCFAFNAGTGTITDYYNNEANNPANPACTRDVDIPSTIGAVGVINIGSSAFLNSQLTGVTIPSSVTSISNNAFSGNQLATVTIPSSITIISNTAFFDNQLTTVTIPSSVTSIGNSAFSNNRLTNVVIPNGVTSIGFAAFSYNQLNTITIPASVSSVGEWAFSDNQLASVTIPNAAATMQHTSFIANPLISMTIGSTTYIGQTPTTDPACFVLAGSTVGDYRQASPLVARDNGVLCGREVIIPNTVTSIGNSAFYGNQLTAVTIPSSVMSIGSSAFWDNELTSITVPESVTSIGNNAFSNNRLTGVTIPDSVTTIGYEAFEANRIREVTIPSSVTSIGELAFALQTPQGRAYDRFDLGDDPVSVALANQTIGEFFYTKLYTEDPSNPNNLQSEVAFYSTELDGLDQDWDEIAVVGGHIVNPASAEFQYVNQSNASLQSSQTFTGQLEDSTYLTSYNASQGPAIPIPLDAWNPTPEEIQAALDALSAYYRIGDTVTIDPPAIDGYITPPTQTFVLGAADNQFSYVYTQPGSIVATPVARGGLAITGAPLFIYIAGALGLSLLGAVALLRRR